jgi:NhaA family Na+:H+ antiporter
VPVPRRNPPLSNPPTFLTSDRALARLTRPLARFLQVEAAGGIVLVAAAIVALVWANSSWQDGYASFWSTPIELQVGSYHFEEDLRHWVNDALMAVFFFVVGMEIKHELVEGELRDRRAVALPAMAALGGMIVPALIYLAFNPSSPENRGWGIPMATDIAFALGVLALLDRRVPPALKVFLLTLAIVDDIGAIVVIAIFYTDDLEPAFLLAAVAIALAVAAMVRVRIVYPPLYALAAAALWLTIYESGVHATIAGVVMGLLTPATPLQSDLDANAIVDRLENRGDLTVEDVRETARAVTNSVSVCERLIDVLHPWTSYVIVPVFALANAGVVLDRETLTNASPVLAGVAVGLVLGKLVGIAAFSWLACRLRIGVLPTGTRWSHMAGVAVVAGIGFTVSLFITGLAFEDARLQDEAKLGVLLASVVAAAAGAFVLIRADRSTSEE